MRRLPIIGLLMALVGALFGLLGPVATAGAAPARTIQDQPEETPTDESEDRSSVDHGRVSVLEIQGLIDPVIADFIKRSIREGEAAGVVAVVLQLNSPGTALDTSQFRSLARTVDEASVPVAVWVGPAGSSATGGAATLAGVADHVGISPGSRLGKTGPIHPDVEKRLSEPFLAAEQRLRKNTINPDEAKELGIAPTDAPVIGDFLVDIPGFESTTVEIDGVKRREPLTVPVFSSIPIQDQLFHTVASPPAAYLLFLIGLSLIVFEMFTAGVGIAGLAGAGCFLLSAYGLSVLSARPLGIALLCLAMFGFTVDVQTGAPRVWTGIGAVALVAGSLTLYDGHSLSWIALAAGILGVPLFMLAGMPSMVRTRFATPTIGREWMIGEEGEAVTRIDPEGVVRVRGALWRARTNRATPLALDDGVRVTEVDGLLLEVEPLEGGARDHRERRRGGDDSDASDGGDDGPILIDGEPLEPGD